MFIVCPQCDSSIEFASVKPNFCASCGQSLKEVGESTEVGLESPTVMTDPQLAATSAPSTRIGATEVPSTIGPEVETNHVGDRMQIACPGQVIDGYKLERQLGQGGMGVVWEAVHETSGRRVALKLLTASLAGNEQHTDRFMREARLAASLSHPRSTFVFGAGQHGTNPYIVMELMPGDTLQHVVERSGELGIDQAVDYMLDVIDGLQAAHELGVIHRDVKPSNCFLDADGRVKVGDFGLSKSLAADSNLTRTGAFLGTPLYAAPEQIRGDTVDERTDVYAVAATLFYLLTGEGPFAGDAVAVIAQIASEPPRKLKQLLPNAPRGLDHIIAKALEKSPEKRYRSLVELRSALRPYSSGGTQIADIWRRLAAYFVDSTLYGFLMGMLTGFGTLAITIILIAMGYRKIDIEQLQVYVAESRFLLQSLQTAVVSLLFAATESRWGRGIGKALLGLKVVDENGESPSSWRSLIRVAFIPLALGLQYMVVFMGAETLERPESIWQVIGVILATLPATLFYILCFVTVRRANGFRAIHDYASGTRVIRISDGVFKARKFQLPKPDQVETDWQGKVLGPYIVTGELAHCHGQRTLTGMDQMLDRVVWIRLQDSTAGVANHQEIYSSAPLRPTRPHWLQGGVIDDTVWNAHEAIQGAPLHLALEHVRDSKWSAAAEWLRDLTQELIASLDEGSLPTNLQINHVWVEESHRIRLLETPIGTPPPPDWEIHQASDESQQEIVAAIELLRCIVEHATNNEVVSPATRDVIEAFRTKSYTVETLRWFLEQMNEIVAKPRAVTRGLRTGSVAIAMGAESTILVFTLMIVILVGTTIWQIPAVPMTLGTIAVVLGALGYIGAMFGGGLEFHFLRIAVVRRDGRPAGRIRCAMRNIVTWLGYVCSMSILWMIVGAMLQQENGRDAVIALGTTPTQFAIFAIIAVMGGIIFAVGGVFAIVFPRRALQDLVCGTRLVPK